MVKELKPQCTEKQKQTWAFKHRESMPRATGPQPLKPNCRSGWGIDSVIWWDTFTANCQSKSQSWKKYTAALQRDGSYAEHREDKKNTCLLFRKIGIITTWATHKLPQQSADKLTALVAFESVKPEAEVWWDPLGFTSSLTSGELVLCLHNDPDTRVKRK